MALSDFMQGLKSAILAIFQNGLGWLCSVSATLKNPSQEFKNSFCFGCRLIPRKTGKAKLERAHFSKVQSGKITVCLVHLIPKWLVCAEINCKVHVALPKRPINRF